jgi:hypothetical protein
VEELRAAGATELLANPIGPPATFDHTLDALAGWARGHGNEPAPGRRPAGAPTEGEQS